MSGSSRTFFKRAARASRLDPRRGGGAGRSPLEPGLERGGIRPPRRHRPRRHRRLRARRNPSLQLRGRIRTGAKSTIDFGGGPLTQTTDFGGGPLVTTQFFLAQLDGANAATGPGSVSDLWVGKSGADLLFTWGADCGLGDAYGIYRGDLALGYGSLTLDSCDLAATQATVPMGAADGEFFLVVPTWSAEEGSYGPSTAGDRAPVPGACHLQGSLDACVP